MSKNIFVCAEIQTDGQRNPLTMAVVKSITDGKAVLLMEGEEIPTQKKYKIIKGSSIAEGDRVVCAKISGTYIVIGAIN